MLPWIRANHPDVRIMGYGQLMEVYKDMGLPVDVAKRYGLAAYGRHATPSAIPAWRPRAPSPPSIRIPSRRRRICAWCTTARSPTTTICASGSGSRARSSRPTTIPKWPRATSPIACTEGATLKEAMEAGLTDLDGFFTFTMGTKDGFAVLRDAVACKPAVLAENDDWVAMASSSAASPISRTSRRRRSGSRRRPPSIPGASIRASLN